MSEVPAKESADPAYDPLAHVLLDALKQASGGKGRERHANGRPFDRQPIMELGRMTGVGGPVFQAAKKAQEACGMARRGEHERAIFELLGAINYLGAAVLVLREEDAAAAGKATGA